MRSVIFPKLHGGAPALDFVDTVDPRVGPEARDFLTSPEALALWAEYAGLVQNGDAGGEDGLRRALELRETLYRIFVAIAGRRGPAADDLQRFLAEYAATLSRAEVLHEGGRYAVAVPPERGVDAILWPVLDSAFELLTTADTGRIKLCPGTDCGWLFLDSSRGGTRRWCSMQSCGAREKMRRLRARARG